MTIPLFHTFKFYIKCIFKIVCLQVISSCIFNREGPDSGIHNERAAVTHIGGLFSPPVSQTTAVHQENIQWGPDDGAAKSLFLWDKASGSLSVRDSHHISLMRDTAAGNCLRSTQPLVQPIGLQSV